MASQERLRSNNRSHNRGFTLVEVLVATLFLAMAIVPMVNAFSPAIFATSENVKTAAWTSQATGTLIRIMALDFETLENNLGDPVDLAALFGSDSEGARESFVFGGETYTPIVSLMDPTGGVGGVVEIVVTVSDIRVTTLKAEY